MATCNVTVVAPTGAQITLAVPRHYSFDLLQKAIEYKLGDEDASQLEGLVDVKTGRSYRSGDAMTFEEKAATFVFHYGTSYWHARCLHYMAQLVDADSIALHGVDVFCGSRGRREPDLAIIASHNTKTLLEPRDCQLIIEISHITFQADTGIKRIDYDEGGAQHYLVVGPSSNGILEYTRDVSAEGHLTCHNYDYRLPTCRPTLHLPGLRPFHIAEFYAAQAQWVENAEKQQQQLN